MSSSSHIQVNVAVLGGTGVLGKPISTVLLTEFRKSFPTVRVFTRSPSSSTAQELAQKGAEVVVLEIDNLENAFAGIDVVVNVLPTWLSLEDRRAINDAAMRSNAKVHFLSDFGLDFRLLHFDGYDHPLWAGKKVLAAEARALAKDRAKIISLYPGMFPEFILTPTFGIDVNKNIFAPYGPATQRFAVTSMPDIGRAVARLTQLSLDPSTATSVPDEVRIAGSNVSYEEVRDIVASVKGVPKADIERKDLEKLQAYLREKKGDADFLDYIRAAVGEDWTNFGETDNEFVNPGEKLWRWTTVEDYVRDSV